MSPQVIREGAEPVKGLILPGQYRVAERLYVLQADGHVDQQDLLHMVGVCPPCLQDHKSFAVNPKAAHVSVFELK